jgi:hypothetical protein
VVHASVFNGIELFIYCKDSQVSALLQQMPILDAPRVVEIALRRIPAPLVHVESYVVSQACKHIFDKNISCYPGEACH